MTARWRALLTGRCFRSLAAARRAQPPEREDEVQGPQAQREGQAHPAGPVHPPLLLPGRAEHQPGLRPHHLPDVPLPRARPPPPLQLDDLLRHPFNPRQARVRVWEQARACHPADTGPGRPAHHQAHNHPVHLQVRGRGRRATAGQAHRLPRDALPSPLGGAG